MADKRFGLGMLVLVLGMAVVGCDNDPGHGGRWNRVDETLPDVEMTGDWTTLNVEVDGNTISLSRPSGTIGSLDGVWTGTLDGTSIVVTFTDTNWITRDTAGNEMARGTVTISGSNVSITITHLMDSGGNGGGANGSVDGGDNAPALLDPTGVWDFIINDLPITLTIRHSSWIFDAGDSELDAVGIVYDFDPFHDTVITLRRFDDTNIGYAKLTSATTMILDLVGHPAVAGTFYGTRSELGVFDRTWSRGSDRLVISGANYIFRQVRDGTLMDVSSGTFQYPIPTWGSFIINQTHLINYSTGQLELNSQSETGHIGFFMGGHFELSGFSSFPVNGSWDWRRN